MVKPTVDALDIDAKTGTTLGFYTYGQHRPNILIISGTNGLSATDVYASYLIMKHLQDLSRVDGSVTLLPVAGPLAFRLAKDRSAIMYQSFCGDAPRVHPCQESNLTDRIASGCAKSRE
jgi:hypothetical protein